MKYCRICTRNFYFEAEKKVVDGICIHCNTEMNKIRSTVPESISIAQKTLEEMVARKKRKQLDSFLPSTMRKKIKEAGERDKES